LSPWPADLVAERERRKVKLGKRDKQRQRQRCSRSNRKGRSRSRSRSNSGEQASRIGTRIVKVKVREEVAGFRWLAESVGQRNGGEREACKSGQRTRPRKEEKLRMGGVFHLGWELLSPDGPGRSPDSRKLMAS